jgi:hypothetical protein
METELFLAAEQADVQPIASWIRRQWQWPWKFCHNPKLSMECHCCESTKTEWKRWPTCHVLIQAKNSVPEQIHSSSPSASVLSPDRPCFIPHAINSAPLKSWPHLMLLWIWFIYACAFHWFELHLLSLRWPHLLPVHFLEHTSFMMALTWLSLHTVGPMWACNRFSMLVASWWTVVVEYFNGQLRDRPDQLITVFRFTPSWNMHCKCSECSSSLILIVLYFYPYSV